MTPLVTIDLLRVGVVSVAPSPGGAGGDPETYVAELYSEGVAIESLQLAHEGFERGR